MIYPNAFLVYKEITLYKCVFDNHVHKSKTARAVIPITGNTMIVILCFLS
jgi:hypothetical protein